MRLSVIFVLVIAQLHRSFTSNSVIRINSEAELEDKLTKAADRLVVIEFDTSSCGPCVLMENEVNTMASSEFSDVIFLKVDIEELVDVASKYDVILTPTYFLMKSSKRVGSTDGPNADILRETIQKNM